MIVLRQFACHDFDSCADAVAIAFSSFKLESQPVILAGAVVDPDFRRRADRAGIPADLSPADLDHRDARRAVYLISHHSSWWSARAGSFPATTSIPRNGSA